MVKSESDKADLLWATIRNLPSDQIARVFDRYMEFMLEPIALYTDALYEGIAEALVLLTNQRRKITTGDRERTVSHLFFTMSADRATIVKTVMDLGIERNILFDVIFRVMIDDTITVYNIELEPLRRHLSVLLDDLMTFRSLVFKRYMPLVNNRSSKFVWERRQKGLLIENADASQNYALAGLRALDRFNPKEGTLTGYLGQSLRNAAHSTFNMHIGESFSLTRNARDKIHKGDLDINNHSISIHDDPVVANIIDETDNSNVEYDKDLESTVEVLQSVGNMEPYRLALAILGAPFELSTDELQKQRDTLKRN